MRSRSLFKAGVASLAIALGLTGCASNNATEPTGSNAPEQSESAEQPLVFTSTDVWASVAREVGGDAVQVVTPLDNPNADPHDYEATAKDKLEVNKAAVVIFNGGGYDDWAGQLAKSAPDKPFVIDAVEVSGVDTSKEPFNEHVFYDLGAVEKVADALKTELNKKDPAHASAYTANYEAFAKEIKERSEAGAAFAKTHTDATAVATEPVVGYVLDELGIKNVTPEAFVEQSETAAGPSVKVTEDTLNLIRDKKVSVLVLNAQTEDAVSDKLAKAAQEAGVPIVKVHETMPQGVTEYLALYDSVVTDLQNALK